jgi:hypothetical protein
MSNSEYAKGFIDALEYALGLFNRIITKASNEKCSNCKYAAKIGELLTLAKEKRFEQIEQEIGFFLH